MKNLIAAISLFSELYDNQKDIYDVIAELIIGAISSVAKWSFTSSEVVQLLEETYDFSIPEAVIKATINKKLKKENLIRYDNGYFIVNEGEIKNRQKVIEHYENLKLEHNKIFKDLISYYDKKRLVTLSENELEELEDKFKLFLVGKSIPDKYSTLISSFIIENRANSKFVDILNSIKEGIIIYEGICYTIDLNSLGYWNYELNIYIDTEHLFNSAGLNGTIYKDMFDDFYKLTQEINVNNRKKTGKNIIHLKYFEEIETEINNFFSIAERIVEGKAVLDPSKTAMIEIINGCKKPSDVITKRNLFFQNLQTKGIHLDAKVKLYQEYEFNIEDISIINELKSLAEENDKEFDENDCVHYLRIFSKINTLRKGINQIGFEKIGHILLTGKRYVQYMAHNRLIKTNEKDIPFATDIDFITDKFWFKLKKGFNKKEDLPKSFNYITKAQIIISNQINRSISKKYAEVTQKINSGELTNDNAISIYADIRDRSSKPEEIVPELVDKSVSFLKDSFIEEHINEKNKLLQKVNEGEIAIKELRRRDAIESRKSRKWGKKIIKFYYYIITIVTIILLILMPIIIWGLISLLKSPQDTKLSILGIFITIISEVFLLLKKSIKFNKWLSIKLKLRYKNNLTIKL